MADNTLFHQGDLQSGIATAIRERKVVACFVRADGDHWSQVWEDYWLSNMSHPTDMISDDQPPLGLIIQDYAILLRLEFGSKEAGFLAAFVKVEKAPTMVVIKDGKVLEKLEGGIGREEFSQKLLKAVGFNDVPVAPGDTLFDLEDEEELVDDIGGRQMMPDSQQATSNLPSRPAVASSSTSSPPSNSAQSSTQAQTLLAERAQRLEAERIKHEAAEKAERTARANARRKEAEDAAAAQAGKERQRSTTQQQEKEKARDAWIYQQKQRKDEAKKERERILAQIENDKQERRAQVLRKKESEQLTGAGASSELPAAKSSAAGVGQWCKLQVRLFDGSSLRGKFASDADITTAVRTWVKEASPVGGADIPYNFRQILAPQPSRTIEVAEESKSLLDLGLVPSATLVLVPVAGATDAYSAAGRGYMSSALHAAYWAANTAYGLVGSAFSYVPGFGGTTGGPYIGGIGDEHEQSNVEGARMADADSSNQSTGSIKVRSLADQRRESDKAQKPAEFYNGNSSAFQGRKDDGDE